MSDNEIIRSRGINQGVISAEDAIKYSATGPLLRASGVPYDIRRADPYSIYDRFDFDIVTRQNGDIYDRYMVRLEEMRQSIRIIQQATNSIPTGEIQTGKTQYQVRVPEENHMAELKVRKENLGFMSSQRENPIHGDTMYALHRSSI